VGGLPEGVPRADRGPLAEAYKLAPAEAHARIDRLLEGLEWFDAVEITQRVAPGRATLTLRLKTLPALATDDDVNNKKPH
jgi:hypothetical protein